MTYTKASEWGGGYTANITVADTGSTAWSSWTVTWTYPGDQKVTSAWNAAVTQTGSAVTATNMAYNGTVAAGSSASFGMQGTWTSNDTSPTSFAVNGRACT